MSSRHHRYKTIAMGGTFDQIHKGHESLFKRAFDTGENVVIGLASDELVKKLGKKILHDYNFRYTQLNHYIKSTFPGRNYTITSLDSTYGPGMFTSRIDAIAVSEETLSGVDDANKKRVEKGLAPLKVEVVSMITAEDGKRISSTRIRAGEIDTHGKIKSS
jgi:pantetheine-phosphate adenylyltransferase